MITDIASNRRGRKYSFSIQIARVLWGCAEVLFRLTPRSLHGVRCWILRMFGARIGNRVHIFPTVRVFFPWNLIVGDHAAIGDRVDIYNLDKAHIGNRTTISQGAYLCGGTHDFESVRMELVKKEIWIGEDVWICAQAFISPGVRIGDGAVVGARSVVTRDVEAWAIVGGNPSRKIRNRVIRSE